MVIDANTGRVLHASEADALRHPASLTKMMTLYLVFEAIERGRASYGTKIKISQEAAAAAPSKLDLDPGEEITVIDAIRALVTKSANDVAVALAEHFAGSEDRFATAMTAKARQIGMTRTTFRNASGLPDAEQVTTARDMLTLSLRLIDDFPRHYTLFSTRAFTYGNATYRNHNTLLGTFEGVDGIKTGYTRMSGFNLVSSVRRGGRHVVGVVFGGASAGIRNAEMRRLITLAITKASPERTRKAAPVLVAEARPATRPAAKPRPQPKPEEVPPAAAPAAKDRSPPQAAPAAPLQPEEEAPRIHIARVRPVMVAPRPRTPIEAPQTESTDEAETRHQSAPRPIAFAQAGVFTRAAAQPVEASAGESWHTRQPLGALPSTLDRQAHNIARGSEPLVPASIRDANTPVFAADTNVPAPQPIAASYRRPEAAPAPAPAVQAAAVEFHIQVGAFASAAEADRALVQALQKSGPLLAAATPLTRVIDKSGRQLHRARFAGFSAQSAATTCMELRQRQIDCFVMRAE
jgi:D-alanyl-D-alanine carboxypeptidase